MKSPAASGLFIVRLPKHEDELMTIAERLEQEDIEKGIVIGENRGIEKGGS